MPMQRSDFFVEYMKDAQEHSGWYFEHFGRTRFPNKRAFIQSLPQSIRNIALANGWWYDHLASLEGTGDDYERSLATTMNQLPTQVDKRTAFRNLGTGFLVGGVALDLIGRAIIALTNENQEE